MREQKRSATLRSKSGDARRVAGQAGGSWYDLTAEDQRLEEEAAARVAGLEAERDAAVEAARRNAEELVEQLRAAQVAALDDLDDRTARDQQVARAADTLAEFQEQVVGMAEKHRAQLAAYDAKIAGFEEMVQRAAQREEEERAALIAQCEATNDAIAERAALHAEENARKIAELTAARFRARAEVRAVCGRARPAGRPHRRGQGAARRGTLALVLPQGALPRPRGRTRDHVRRDGRRVRADGELARG